MMTTSKAAGKHTHTHTHIHTCTQTRLELGLATTLTVTVTVTLTMTGLGPAGTGTETAVWAGAPRPDRLTAQTNLGDCQNQTRPNQAGPLEVRLCALAHYVTRTRPGSRLPESSSYLCPKYSSALYRTK